MFCTKCGHENADDAGVCTQCGASVVSEESIGEITNSEVPMTKKEYFMSKCSTSTKQKRKAVKILSTVSLTIQGVLAVLGAISYCALAYTMEQDSFVIADYAIVMIGSAIATMLFYLVGSFVFTILGAKKNSTGFFVAATFFGFLSVMYSSMNFILELRQLTALGTLVIYIAITVLSYQSNKEYKKYISQHKGETVL